MRVFVCMCDCDFDLEKPTMVAILFLFKPEDKSCPLKLGMYNFWKYVILLLKLGVYDDKKHCFYY